MAEKDTGEARSLPARHGSEPSIRPTVLSSIKLAAGQQRALEMIARGAEIGDVLDHVILTIEEHAPGVRGSVLLLRDGTHVHHCSAPSLPAEYCRLIDGEEIGPRAGSCGTAMFADRRVIVSDIATDPLWESYREVALPFGLRACWSTPIHSSKGQVIGSFAMYYDEPREPTPAELELCDLATHLAGIAIEHETAAEELRAAERRFRGLIENLPLVTFARRPEDMGVAYVSPQIEDLLGYSAEEWTADPGLFARCLHPDDRERVLAATVDAATREDAFAGEYRLIARDGRTVWVRDRTTVVEDDEGRALLRQGYWIDLTAEKEAHADQERLERELRQAHRMEVIGRLAGGVAHDFNNVLTAIGGYGGFLYDALDEGDPRRGDAHEILKAVERARTLTRHLLSFSRHGVVIEQRLDLNEIVAEIDRLLRRLIGTDVELVTTLDPELGNVEGDRGQVEQVIVNLALNARDAMPEGGKILIQTANMTVADGSELPGVELPPGEYVTVTVADTATGRERVRGTGLAPSIVAANIDELSGAVVVESGPGQDSAFRIYLPRVEAPAEEPPPRPDGAIPAVNRQTVLLVEDEDVLRGLASRVLRASGCRVLEARYASEALQQWKESADEIDVVVTDVVMPGMSGVQLVERLAAERPTLRVVIMSGFTDANVTEQLSSRPGHVTFLQKPFQPSELLAAVASVQESAAG
jgi:two-component system cell cycle sensor histidine kinase/response regulator CckA